jgi:hypothetical protein
LAFSLKRSDLDSLDMSDLFPSKARLTQVGVGGNWSTPNPELSCFSGFCMLISPN